MRSKKKDRKAVEPARVWRIDPKRDAELLARAEAATRDYRMVLDAVEGGGYVGSVAEMPGVIGEGPTADECVRSTRHALLGAAALLLKAGHSPPPSLRGRSRQGRVRREDQLNLRVSADEKQMLERAAQKHGFRSVSEFVRTRAIESILAD
jgi:predicted RNase H-like HicB family nuclease